MSKTTGESSTSPRRLRSIEKQLQALEYRKMGYTFAQIAAALDMRSPQLARHYILAAISRTLREPAEDVLRLELERLDSLFVQPFQAALNGDLAALTACLRLMERKARLLGLDAATKTEHIGFVQIHHMSVADFEGAADRVLRQV